MGLDKLMFLVVSDLASLSVLASSVLLSLLSVELTGPGDVSGLELVRVDTGLGELDSLTNPSFSCRRHSSL